MKNKSTEKGVLGTKIMMGFTPSHSPLLLSNHKDTEMKAGGVH